MKKDRNSYFHHWSLIRSLLINKNYHPILTPPVASKLQDNVSFILEELVENKMSEH